MEGCRTKVWLTGSLSSEGRRLIVREDSRDAGSREASSKAISELMEARRPVGVIFTKDRGIIRSRHSAHSSSGGRMCP